MTEQDEQAQAERERLWREWAPTAGVPLRLRTASMPNPIETMAITATRQYVTEDLQHGRCLVLAGPTGVGKSFAAARVMWAALRGHFWYFPALCSQLLVSETRAEALETARHERLAVFDDFGVEYAKEGGLLDTFLDDIIWHRESDRLATIFTTNLTTEQLVKRLPGRLVDRLRGEWGRVFECPGESLREQELPARATEPSGAVG